jgi:hypothetical protein
MHSPCHSQSAIVVWGRVGRWLRLPESVLVLHRNDARTHILRVPTRRKGRNAGHKICCYPSRCRSVPSSLPSHPQSRCKNRCWSNCPRIRVSLSALRKISQSTDWCPLCLRRNPSGRRNPSRKQSRRCQASTRSSLSVWTFPTYLKLESKTYDKPSQSS